MDKETNNHIPDRLLRMKELNDYLYTNKQSYGSFVVS